MLLIVQQVLALVAARLGLLDLLLARVAAGLATVQLRLPMREVHGAPEVGGVGRRPLIVHLGLLALERGLVHVGEGLLAIGHALVEVRHRLLLVRAAAASRRSGLRGRVVIRHVGGAPVVRSCVQRSWAGDVVALGEIDPDLLQQRVGLGVLDALGHGLQAEAPAPGATTASTTWRLAGLVARSRTNSMSILRKSTGSCLR